MREWDCRKGKSTDARWKDLWEFLFPGAEAPASIYLGTHEEEITSHLYSFWASHSHDITAGVMEDSGVSVERQSEIWVQELFDTFLKHLLGQFKNSEGNSQIKSFGVTSEITPLPSASPFDNVQSTDWHSSVPSEPAIGETILDGEQLESNQLSFTEPNFDFNNVFAGLNYESSLFTTTAWSDSSPFGPLPALDMSSLVDDAFHFGDDPPAMEQRKQPEVIDLRESD
ncbi:hypothetical protein B0T18DRAFT_401174 [Schizothecium vesticola]|uniref:Uncharacterized protein n=1 Tax=Schizothecium vesticola TaxID=314040 RepID=A0AA40F440_9PEZI|nr:hypothetical protein B0T18DRAFT_401174 [Schizothecium vesticola]